MPDSDENVIFNFETWRPWRRTGSLRATIGSEFQSGEDETGPPLAGVSSNAFLFVRKPLRTGTSSGGDLLGIRGGGPSVVHQSSRPSVRPIRRRDCRQSESESESEFD